MLDVKSGTIDAPAVADRVIEFRNEGSLAPVVIVENLDDSASASVKLQEPATINPGESFQWIVSAATLRDLAIHAGGDLKLLVHVTRQADGELSNWGNIR